MKRRPVSGRRHRSQPQENQYVTKLVLAFGVDVGDGVGDGVTLGVSDGVNDGVALGVSDGDGDGVREGVGVGVPVGVPSTVPKKPRIAAMVWFRTLAELIPSKGKPKFTTLRAGDPPLN